jgi:hypothetical protein
MTFINAQSDSFHPLFLVHRDQQKNNNNQRQKYENYANDERRSKESQLNKIKIKFSNNRTSFPYDVKIKQHEKNTLIIQKLQQSSAVEKITKIGFEGHTSSKFPYFLVTLGYADYFTAAAAVVISHVD